MRKSSVSGKDSARGQVQPTKIPRPGSSNGRAFESGIPRPGFSKANTIGMAPSVPVNFTSSNAVQAANPRRGFEAYDNEVPERVPFSSSQP